MTSRIMEVVQRFPSLFLFRSTRETQETGQETRLGDWEECFYAPWWYHYGSIHHPKPLSSHPHERWGQRSLGQGRMG